MYIKKAQLDNFGKFHHKTVCFSPGFNVVYGENESGKSTLQRFLVGMLFGLEKPRGKSADGGEYQRYEPWNTASYFAGVLDFSVAGKDFAIERNFYHREKTARLYNQKDREELSVEHGDLEMLLGGVKKGFYENTYCIAQAAVATEERFARELKQELVNRVHGGESGIDVGRAVRLLEQKQKQSEQKQKICLRGRQERIERLKWEQELLTEDIGELEQKLIAAEKFPVGESKSVGESGAEGAEAGVIEPETQGAEPEEAVIEEGNEEPKGLIWRLPIIGWILRFFRRLFHRKAGRKRVFQQESGKPEQETGNFKQDSGKFRQDVSMQKFLREQLKEQLQEQLWEKQTRLLNVQEELSEAAGLTPKERELAMEVKSLRLAQEVLDRAVVESYQDGRDDIQAFVSEIFSGVTGGKYDRIEVTEAGEVFLYPMQGMRPDGAFEKEIPLTPRQLSRGAMEQLYFALRLGTGRYLMAEEPMPVLLDETFCAYDDVRLKRTLQWLFRQKEQVILFTCQKRELTLLEELGIEHNRILL